MPKSDGNKGKRPRRPSRIALENVQIRAVREAQGRINREIRDLRLKISNPRITPTNRQRYMSRLKILTGEIAKMNAKRPPGM